MRPPYPAALALLLALAVQAAHAERKALVIGNAHYAEGRLENPIHDAEDMQARLKALGFDVVLLEDAKWEDFDRALERFGLSLRAEDDAVFYFAGHGAQSNGVNYLIPADAKINEDADLKYKAVNLGLALDKLAHAQNGFKLAILDACRNNPYARSLRDGSRGLARVDAPSGTLVWYAAQPGKVAEDGKGRNGAFTAQLLDALAQPGLDPDALFKRTARAVYQQTGGRQFPYPEGVSLVDFQFAAGASPPAKPLAPGPAAVELSFWDSIKGSDNVADFEEYLKQYPQGRFAGLARNRLKKLAVQATSPVKNESVAPLAMPEPAANPQTAKSPYGIEMVSLPGGRFQMGCGPKDGECYRSEYPRHTVAIRPFAIGKTEITQGQWKAVMGTLPQHLYFKDCGDDCPVEGVSWDDVQDFIQHLNDETKKRYRLPTEAEWEYACRAGKESLYAGGNDLDQLAWHDGNSGSKSHPVKGKRPNSFGLYDMSGNVREWVQDLWHENYQAAPTDGSAWDAKGEGRLRGVRGGFWDDNGEPTDFRCAVRDSSPHHSDYMFLGFRLSLSP